MSTNVMKVALAVLRQIQDDIEAGQVPETCASFSELHDYVDANEYLTGTVPDRPDGSFDNDLINEVTDAVDIFLQVAVHGRTRQHVLVVGDPVDGVKHFGPFTAEQASEEAERCFSNQTWWVAPLHEPYEGFLRL